jgi:long-chain acyl-CoA synthetase
VGVPHPRRRVRAQPRSIYTYRDLLELAEATTKLHKNRVALRLRPTLRDGEKARDVEPIVYTYGKLADLALVGGGQLRQRGAAASRVMLMSENRPEWGISYFAILQAGSTVVPLDKELSGAEVANLARVSGARRW